MVSSSVLTHHQFFVNPESNPQHLFVAPKNLHRLTICPAPQARIQCFLRRKTSFRRLERLEKDEKKGKADFKSRMKTSSWMALVASFSGAIPGFIFPGIWVWCWVFLQGVLYTTASEMWFYQNVIRAPPDVRSGYTRVRRYTDLGQNTKFQSSDAQNFPWSSVDRICLDAIAASR